MSTKAFNASEMAQAQFDKAAEILNSGNTMGIPFMTTVGSVLDMILIIDYGRNISQ